MKNIHIKLAFIMAGAVALSGCSAILPSPKNVVAENGATVQLTYQDPSDEQQCTEVKEISFNPEFSTYIGFFHSGPSHFDAIELSDNYFVTQAAESDTNYINRDTVTESGFLGLYSTSNDIDAVLFKCDALDAK